MVAKTQLSAKVAPVAIPVQPAFRIELGNAGGVPMDSMHIKLWLKYSDDVTNHPYRGSGDYLWRQYAYADLYYDQLIIPLGKGFQYLNIFCDEKESYKLNIFDPDAVEIEYEQQQPHGSLIPIPLWNDRNRYLLLAQPTDKIISQKQGRFSVYREETIIFNLDSIKTLEGLRGAQNIRVFYISKFYNEDGSEAPAPKQLSPGVYFSENPVRGVLCVGYMAFYDKWLIQYPFPNSEGLKRSVAIGELTGSGYEFPPLMIAVISDSGAESMQIKRVLKFAEFQSDPEETDQNRVLESAETYQEEIKDENGNSIIVERPSKLVFKSSSGQETRLSLDFPVSE